MIQVFMMQRKRLKGDKSGQAKPTRNFMYWQEK